MKLDPDYHYTLIDGRLYREEISQAREIYVYGHSRCRAIALHVFWKAHAGKNYRGCNPWAT